MINQNLLIFLFLILIKQYFVLTETIKERNQNENPHCSEPHDKGINCPDSSIQSSKRFYYNSQTGLCQPFIFNGCEGNSNRFETVNACRKACSSSEKRDPWVLECIYLYTNIRIL
ncbi:BPTI/Kunitz inhibitor domain-containing protein [Meloidogyne graminicola]|uniref:BPTI/Kunitz inhibitor domain-containing protein n=1 Tax=Meloidogyne graminicola TaxID=189291 RepID=A0A8S9ZJ89_9BILA|nr:BPTI/Kunitz inhibitor domain-containing protein [Meloidogyne graminicola]